MRPIRHWALAGLAAALLTAGCAEPPPPPPPPTTVTLALTGSPSMNGGVPAKVQVFYLGSTATFDTQDYFTLSGGPQGALGADLVAVDEYLLQPGTTQGASKTFPVAPTAIGVVAGFRDVDQPGWRATAPIVSNADNAVTVTIGANTVAIETEARKVTTE